MAKGCNKAVNPGTSSIVSLLAKRNGCQNPTILTEAHAMSGEQFRSLQNVQKSNSEFIRHKPWTKEDSELFGLQWPLKTTQQPTDKRATLVRTPPRLLQKINKTTHWRTSRATTCEHHRREPTSFLTRRANKGPRPCPQKITTIERQHHNFAQTTKVASTCGQSRHVCQALLLLSVPIARHYTPTTLPSATCAAVIFTQQTKFSCPTFPYKAGNFSQI